MHRVLAVTLLALPACSTTAADPRPPNVVIVFTDDQGYQDVGCYGSPDIATPNLDRMAAEGMRFTDFYSAAPTCTPSRAALLTGRYAQRVGLPRVLFPHSTTGLPESEVTIAEALKRRGYATACVGKWHLGHLPPFLPTRHGFDEYFGLPYSNDMRPETPSAKDRGDPPLPLLEGEEVVEVSPDQGELTRRYTERAVDFVERNRGRPFFLYLAHTMPHVPLYASPRFSGRSARGPYGDVIEEIDWSAGRILDALARLGLDRRTLVVFTSDNGPWLVKKDHGGSALPLRSGKGTTWEGGMRVPCIARWPGRIPAGATCTGIASTLDLLPTIAALAGCEPGDGRVLDGVDIRPLLRGAPSVDREPFLYFRNRRLQAVRHGRFKLHLVDREDEDGTPIGRPLYDLRADPGERRDVAAQHPDVVRELERRAAELHAGIDPGA